MIVLAIDTAASLCATCVYDAAAAVERGRSVSDVGKGHAEHLMGAIAVALEAAGLEYRDIDRIGVCVGPGSFTGVRVGVAAARGLALALNKPAVGVDALKALAAEARSSFPGRPILAAIDGRRGDLYSAGYAADGAVIATPAAVSVTAAFEWARAQGAALAGNGVDAILARADDAHGLDVASRGATADIAVLARLAAEGVPSGRPKPLYLRSAGAAPQAGFAVRRADG